MNKIFKVIWNHSLSTWVAVSELAKGYVKSSASSSAAKQAQIGYKDQGSFKLSKVAVSLMVLTLSSTALARTQIGSSYDKGNYGTIVIGETGDRPGYSLGASAGIGTGDFTAATRHSIAIGGGANINGHAPSSIAFGYNTVASRADSVAIGSNSQTGKTNLDNASSLPNSTYKFAAAPNANTPVFSVGGSSVKRQIQNVAAGSITSTSTDAINGSQLYAVWQELGNVSGGGITGTIFNLTTSKSGTGNVENTSVSGIEKGNTVTIDASNNINITQNGSTVSIATSDRPNFTSVETGNLTVRPNGNVNFGGNRLTNVSNGTAPTDAVNLQQLNAAKTEVQAGNNVNVTKASGVNGTVYTVNADKATVSNGSDKVKVTSTSGANDTTNYSVDLSDDAKAQLAKEESVNSTSSNVIVTEDGKNNTGGKNYSIALNNTLDLTNAGSVKTGDTVLNNTGLTITGGPSVTQGGINAGNKKITNVDNGTLSSTSKEAVNGSQLYAANQNITNVSNEVAKGWNLTTAKTGTGNAVSSSTANVKMGNLVTVTAGDNINITQAGKNITIATSSTPNFSSVDTGGLTVRPNGQVNFGGNVLQNIGAPVNNNDAVNKKYVDDGRTTVGSTDKSVTVTSSGNNPKNYDLSVNMSKVANDVKLKYSGDNNTTGENALSERVNFKGSDYITTNASNGQVVFDLTQNVKDKINNLNTSSAVATEVKAGKNVNVTNEKATDGRTVYTVNANTSSVSNGSEQVVVNGTHNATTGVTDYSVDLSDTAKNQLKKEESVSAGDSNVNVTLNASRNSTNGTDYIVTLNKDVNLTKDGSLTIGNTTLNDNGLTITKGPSVTKDGINAGDKKITNVSNGMISADSKDAVNGSQLYATNQNITNVSNEVAKGWNLTTSNVGTGAVSGSSVNKVSMGDTVTIEAGDNINITQAAGKISIATSKTPNFTNVTTNGLMVTPNAVVNFGGNVLTNVGAPTNNTDAVNKQYVDAGRTTVNSTDGSVTVNSTGTNPTNYDLAVNMTKVANDVTLKYSADNGNGSNKLADPVKFKGSDYVKTTAKDGEVTFDLSDNAKNKINNAMQNFTVGADKANTATGLNITNGGRFDIVGSENNYIETAVSGNNITVGLNSTAVDSIQKAQKGFGLKAQDGANVTHQLGEAIEVIGGNSNVNTTIADGKVKVNLNNTLDLTRDGGITIGNSTLNDNGLTINNGPSVTKDGVNAGDKKVTNVTNGTLSIDSKDAVNGSQLYATNQNVTNISNEVAKGWNITTSKSGSGHVEGTNVTNVKMGDTVTIDAGNNINITQTNGTISISTSDTPVFGNITVGKNGKDGLIGLNGKDGKSANITVSDGQTTVNPKDKGQNITRIVYNTTDAQGNTVTREVATMDDGLKFKGDNDTIINRTLGSQLNITGGANSSTLTENNIGVVGDVGGNLALKLNKDLNLTSNGSLVIGNATLNGGGLTLVDGPSVTKDGINAGSKPITNVSNGTNATDAVNIQQLNASTAAVKTEVKQGNNVVITNTTATDGHTIYTVNANASSVSNGSDDVVVNGTYNATTGVMDYSVDLSEKAKKQIAKEESVSAGSDLVSITANSTKNSTGGNDFIVNINAQKVVESAQLPVVYTNVNGDKLVKVGDKFYKAGDVTNGTPNSGATAVNNGDVIASLNNGDNSTNTPMNLGNLKGNLGNVTNSSTGNPADANKYDNVKNNAATVGDVLNAGWNLQDNGQAVDFVTHGNTVNFNNGTGVSVKADYNSTTGATNITFNTTNSYVDEKGNLTNEPTNIVKFVGSNSTAPVLITHVASGVDTPNTNGTTWFDKFANVSGDALNNVVNVGDLKNAVNSSVGSIGFNLTSKAVTGTNGDSKVAENLAADDKRLTNNDTFTLDAGNNIAIKQVKDGYEIATTENATFTNITVGKDGKDGTIGVNGANGTGIVLNGKDGSIGLTGPKGADGKNGASANISVANGSTTVNPKDNGQNITRIVYNTTDANGTTVIREVATLDDGLKFKGDNDTVINRTLGSQLNITGGAKEANLTDNNIGVIGNTNGDLVLKLNKDINLTNNGSLAIGNSTLTDGGLNIIGGPSITIGGIDAGNKKITNVADGNVSSGSKDAINGGQLYSAITNSGFNLATNGNATGVTDKRINNNETFNLNEGKNIVVKQIENGYEISTGNNLVIGEKGQNGQNGQPGKDGIDGSIGVNGKDGSAVVINGKDGSIGLNGKDGANGLTIKGGQGPAGVNGKDGETVTRIEYVDSNNATHKVATLDDGLKFKGDSGEVINKKLNETLNITGGANGSLTDNNIGVVNENGNLTVKLAENITLGNNGSLTIGNVTVNKDGLNAGNTMITNVKGNLDNVTNDTKSNPDTASNKYQNITKNAATVGDVLNAGWNLQNNGQAVDFVTHGNSVNFNNGTGVSVKATYDNVTGTTNITFSTTNSYVDNNGNLTNEPTNKVKFVGGNVSAPVLITNVDSGVLPNGTTVPANQTFNSVLNNLTGDALNNVVNVGDLKNATKDITNTTLSAVGFSLKSAKVDGTTGIVEEASGLTDEDKRLTNNETFSLNAGNNIVIKQITNGYEIATSNNVTIGKDGKDGVDGKLGVNGKDGASVVLHGKDGSIGLTGPRGADGKDGASVNITVANGTGTLDSADKGGKGIERLVYNTTNTDGSVITREIATKDDGLKFKGDKGQEVVKKLGETLNITGGSTGTLTDNNIGVVNENGNLTVKLAENITLGNNGSVNIGNTTVNNDGLTIKGGPSITVGGIDAGGKTITNVGNGTNATDAVNLSQLNASAAAAKTEVTAGKNVNVTSDTATDGHTIYTVNAEKSVVTGSDSITVTPSDDRANFTTTYKVELSQSMKDQIAKEESVTAGDSNVKVTPNGTNASGGKDFAVSLNKDLNLTSNGSVTLGNTTLKDGNLAIGNTTLKDGNLTMGNTSITNEGVTIKDGPTITNEKIDAANITISNVGNGDISPTSKDAINGSQLYNSGFNLTTNGQDVATDKRINYNETFVLNQGNNIVVKQIDNGYEIATAENATFTNVTVGKDGKDGVDGTIGVNGKDGASVVINGKDGSIDLTGPKGADGQDGASATVQVVNGAKGLDGNDGKDGESKTRIEYVKKDGNKEQVATLNDGLEFMGDTGTVSQQKLNTRVNVVGGQADESKLSSAPNIGVVSDGKGTLTVKLAKDIDLGQDGSLNIGNTTVNNNGLTIKGSDPQGRDTVSVTDNGISAGNKVISNVAPGVKPTDAVNKGQLDQVRGDIYNVNNRVDDLDKRVRGIGANAAAAASLPQVYIPGKSMVAAAAGGYSGASAIAVGYSRASDNGKVILKLTGTANSAGHYSGGVGVGYQW
ncbi:YadA-like family protein [Rodentibacter myodis]|uniref:Autotransporter domain-containing protein n=1 Tax=Rodentibacter myodis TaxID=1907939 RepID=A0A1V3JNZ0_9PAST|nr:YadA-like family protein [Rodentibacter myodis]OOF58536.1 hypothetical protein BKL49_07230 [Rodentibacter myodis]